MIKNNKGVTLVELLIVIVVMGIIAAFAIPAVGTIIENTNKDAIVADAIALENAANLYCAQTSCDADQDLTWTEVSPYVSGLASTDYSNANGTLVMVSRASISDPWLVVLVADGTNNTLSYYATLSGTTYTGATPSDGAGRVNVH